MLKTKAIFQLISWRDKIQENPIFHGNIYGFRLRFSLSRQPIEFLNLESWDHALHPNEITRCTSRYLRCPVIGQVMAGVVSALVVFGCPEPRGDLRPAHLSRDWMTIKNEFSHETNWIFRGVFQWTMVMFRGNSEFFPQTKVDFP